MKVKLKNQNKLDKLLKEWAKAIKKILNDPKMIDHLDFNPKGNLQSDLKPSRWGLRFQVQNADEVK